MVKKIKLETLGRDPEKYNQKDITLEGILIPGSICEHCSGYTEGQRALYSGSITTDDKTYLNFIIAFDRQKSGICSSMQFGNLRMSEGKKIEFVGRYCLWEKERSSSLRIEPDNYPNHRVILPWRDIVYIGDG